jgi:hypothetical protein
MDTIFIIEKVRTDYRYGCSDCGENESTEFVKCIDDSVEALIQLADLKEKAGAVLEPNEDESEDIIAWITYNLYAVNDTQKIIIKVLEKEE